jgi:tellurite resistance protein TerC
MLLPWVWFLAFIAGMLVLDLGVFHRKAHVVTTKESLIWSLVWFGMALLFGLYILYSRGGNASITFFTGYLIEKSLSLDNLFVFIVIFKSFQVPSQYQHRVLFWGVLGALVLRAIFILSGVVLIQKFEWVLYLFGAFLIYAAVRFLRQEVYEEEVSKKSLMLWGKKLFRLTSTYAGDRFFILKKGKRYATPLLIVLVGIECSDILFAVDSIPAILAITQDSYLIFTSNIFAVLGLRSLYFAIAHLAIKFRFLAHGLSVILSYIGVKLLVRDFFSIPPLVSLSVIALTLASAIIFSLLCEAKQKRYQPE